MNRLVIIIEASRDLSAISDYFCDRIAVVVSF